jgi:hypothetical protein
LQWFERKFNEINGSLTGIQHGASRGVKIKNILNIARFLDRGFEKE